MYVSGAVNFMCPFKQRKLPLLLTLANALIMLHNVITLNHHVLHHVTVT